MLCRRSVRDSCFEFGNASLITAVGERNIHKLAARGPYLKVRVNEFDVVSS